MKDYLGLARFLLSKRTKFLFENTWYILSILFIITIQDKLDPRAKINSTILIQITEKTLCILSIFVELISLSDRFSIKFNVAKKWLEKSCPI